MVLSANAIWIAGKVQCKYKQGKMAVEVVHKSTNCADLDAVKGAKAAKIRFCVPHANAYMCCMCVQCRLLLSLD